MELKKLWKNKRNLAFQGLNLAMIVFSALMIWKGLMFVTLSESPVVVVLRLVIQWVGLASITTTFLPAILFHFLLPCHHFYIFDTYVHGIA